MIEKFKDYIKTEGNSELFDKKHGFKNIDYTQLIELYKDDNYIPYAQYLRTDRWKTKRLEILDRDRFLCRNCGAYNTVSRQTKLGEINLEWWDVEVILWTDTKGEERISSPNRPEGLPAKAYNLQIHHKKYIVNRLPWDYDNSDLLTLCNFCHNEEHEQNTIPIYDEYGKLIADHPYCGRCRGSGYLPEYRHVQDGVCFECGGTGYDIQFINKKII